MEYIHFLLNLTIVLLLIQAALKDSKTNYTLLLLQTLSMAVILRVETKFHFRQTTYVMHIILIQIFGTTLTQLTSYVLTSFSFSAYQPAGILVVEGKAPGAKSNVLIRLEGNRWKLSSAALNSFVACAFQVPFRGEN